MKNEKEKTERKEKKTIGKKASGKGRDSLGCGAVRSRFSQHRIFSAQCWLSSFHANTIKIGTTRRKRDWPKIRSFHQCLATKQRREGEKKKETDEKANRVCTQNAALRSKATMSKDCFCLKTAKKKQLKQQRYKNSCHIPYEKITKKGTPYLKAHATATRSGK